MMVVRTRKETIQVHCFSDLVLVIHGVDIVGVHFFLANRELQEYRSLRSLVVLLLVSETICSFRFFSEDAAVEFPEFEQVQNMDERPEYVK